MFKIEINFKATFGSWYYASRLGNYIDFQEKNKYVLFFAKDLDQNKKNKLAIGLEMLKLGMSTQIVQFNGTYYKHIT